MTAQEAIKSLKNIIEYWTYKPTEVQTAKTAIEALKKQVPIMPTPDNIYIPKIKDREDYSGYCECGDRCIYSNGEYCPTCGQKLAWDKLDNYEPD